jgi:hypothetical protein
LSLKTSWARDKSEENQLLFDNFSIFLVVSIAENAHVFVFISEKKIEVTKCVVWPQVFVQKLLTIWRLEQNSRFRTWNPTRKPNAYLFSAIQDKSVAIVNFAKKNYINDFQSKFAIVLVLQGMLNPPISICIVLFFYLILTTLSRPPLKSNWFSRCLLERFYCAANTIIFQRVVQCNKK